MVYPNFINCAEGLADSKGRPMPICWSIKRWGLLIKHERGSLPFGKLIILVLDSELPCEIWSCVEPEIFSEVSKAVMSRVWVLKCTVNY